MDKGIPIRAISRGLAVLQMINRHRSMTMMEIAREADVPYPTACRILQTLIHEGWVERDDAAKRYRPTALVRSLASGYSRTDVLVETARTRLAALGDAVLWPIVLCTRVGKNMMVHNSTHALSPLTYDVYDPGYTLPILDCAAGKAYLAYADPEEARMVLAAVEEDKTGIDRSALEFVKSGALFDAIRKQGYAGQTRNVHSQTPGKTSAIAAPVLCGERAVASISMVFFDSTMSVAEAAEKHLDALQETTHAISADLEKAYAGREDGGFHQSAG